MCSIEDYPNAITKKAMLLSFLGILRNTWKAKVKKRYYKKKPCKIAGLFLSKNSLVILQL
jgi:hypothetical protein